MDAFRATNWLMAGLLETWHTVVGWSLVAWSHLWAHGEGARVAGLWAEYLWISTWHYVYFSGIENTELKRDHPDLKRSGKWLYRF